MMPEQLTFKTFGGATVAVPARGKHYIEPSGYVAKPGSGPAGETCGSCQHVVGRGSRFLKCNLARAKWTHTRRTDILARAPACSKWAKAK